MHQKKKERDPHARNLKQLQELEGLEISKLDREWTSKVLPLEEDANDVAISGIAIATCDIGCSDKIFVSGGIHPTGGTTAWIHIEVPLLPKL